MGLGPLVGWMVGGSGGAGSLPPCQSACSRVPSRKAASTVQFIAYPVAAHGCPPTRASYIFPTSVSALRLTIDLSSEVELLPTVNNLV